MRNFSKINYVVAELPFTEEAIKHCRYKVSLPENETRLARTLTVHEAIWEEWTKRVEKLNRAEPEVSIKDESVNACMQSVTVSITTGRITERKLDGIIEKLQGILDEACKAVMSRLSEQEKESHA